MPLKDQWTPRLHLSDSVIEDASSSAGSVKANMGYSRGTSGWHILKKNL